MKFLQRILPWTVAVSFLALINSRAWAINYVTASPNPVQLGTGQKVGSTTISWDFSPWGSAPQYGVWVAIISPAGYMGPFTLFSCGAKGSAVYSQVALSNTYLFEAMVGPKACSDSSSPRIAGTEVTAVQGAEVHCPNSVITATFFNRTSQTITGSLNVLGVKFASGGISLPAGQQITLTASDVEALTALHNSRVINGTFWSNVTNESVYINNNLGTSTVCPPSTNLRTVFYINTSGKLDFGFTKQP